MYAVVQAGGKQYRITPGDYVVIERIPGENGDKIELKDILLVDDEGNLTFGSPIVKDALVKATIVDQSRARKIIVFKKKRRKNYRRKHGHRQHQTVLHISEIQCGGKSAKTEKQPNIKPAIKLESAEIKTKTASSSKVASTKKKAAVEESTPVKKAPAKKAPAKKTEDVKVED